VSIKPACHPFLPRWQAGYLIFLLSTDKVNSTDNIKMKSIDLLYEQYVLADETLFFHDE